MAIVYHAGPLGERLSTGTPSRIGRVTPNRGFGSLGSNPAGGAYPTGLSGAAVSPCQTYSVEMHSYCVFTIQQTETFAQWLAELRDPRGRLWCAEGPHRFSDADGEAWSSGQCKACR